MEKIQTVELIIDSRDESVVRNIEQQFSGVEITRGRTARVSNPITALAIAAQPVKLASELVGLWLKLQQKPDATIVTLRNMGGKSLVMSDVTTEQLRAFLETSSP